LPEKRASHSKMKFSNVLLFSTFALAAPKAPVVEERVPSIELVERTPFEIEERGDSVVGAVLGAVNSVVKATEDNIAAIHDLVDGVTGAVDVDIEAAVRANLNAIAAALQQAASTIKTSTTNVFGGIIGAASGLTQQQINSLIQAVNGALDAINQLQVIIDAQATDLTPELVQALQSEIRAIQNAISPFIGPLVRFARAVQLFSARIGVTVRGLQGVTQQLTSVVTNLLKSLGLDLLIPGLFQ
jgi:acyl-CoA hydrolase